MTRLYIDTEFNSNGGSLISMAIVHEDGKQIWYEVVKGDWQQDCHPWVKENVLPKLEGVPIERVDFQRSFSRFVSKFKEPTVIADWPEDIAHFCNAMVLDEGRRVKVLPTFQLVSADYTSEVPHNALYDAMALRNACERGQ